MKKEHANKEEIIQTAQRIRRVFQSLYKKPQSGSAQPLLFLTNSSQQKTFNLYQSLDKKPYNTGTVMDEIANPEAYNAAQKKFDEDLDKEQQSGSAQGAGQLQRQNTLPTTLSVSAQPLSFLTNSITNSIQQKSVFHNLYKKPQSGSTQGAGLTNSIPLQNLYKKPQSGSTQGAGQLQRQKTFSTALSSSAQGAGQLQRQNTLPTTLSGSAQSLTFLTNLIQQQNTKNQTSPPTPNQITAAAPAQTKPLVLSVEVINLERGLKHVNEGFYKEFEINK